MQQCNSAIFLQNHSDPHDSPFKSCNSMWSLTESPRANMFSVSCLFLCSYCMMQSCWALDSRKRPSFSHLVSSLACQLAEAEGAVSKTNMWTMSGFGFLWGLCVAPQITMRWGIDSCFLLKYTTLWWDTLPMDPHKSLGLIFLPPVRILTFLMRIFFLLLLSLGFWKAEVSQPVLREWDSLVQQPVQSALVMLIAATGGELSMRQGPGGLMRDHHAVFSQIECCMSLWKVKIIKMIWGSPVLSIPDVCLLFREDKQLLSKLPILTCISTLD